MTRTENTHSEAVVSYRCPYCEEATYPTEMLVRAHICWADDRAHADHDGMTPEVEPIEVDADGDPVGRAFTLAGQLNLHALELEDIPESYGGQEFNERERRALLVAAFNANKSLSYPSLTERVGAHLDGHDLSSLGQTELEQLCEGFFSPHRAADDEVTAGDITTAETTLRDLTALQQAIVLAHVTHPQLDHPVLATQIGTAASYPPQVIGTHTALVDRLSNRLEGDCTVERLIAERIPSEDLSEIVTEQYLDEFDIDLSEASDRKHRSGPRSDPSTGPSTGDLVGFNEHTAPADETMESSQTRPETPSDRTETAHVGQSTSAESSESRDTFVPRNAVESVRNQVAFDLDVLEREMELAEPTPQQARTKAYLEQILERLDELLS